MDTPRHNPHTPVKFRHKRHGRILLAIAALEAIVIVGLLIWVVALKPAKTPVTTPTTPKPATSQTPHVALGEYAKGFTAVTAIAPLPGGTDNRLYVTEQAGTIRIINPDKTVDPTPLLDISGKVLNNGEMGLLGLAFHPKASTNGYFYVNYIDKSQSTVISRFTISQKTGRADPKSEKVILTLKQPYPNHNGGGLAFGPDGYLYASLGDGGSSGDPENRAQDLRVLFGKILRLDVDNGDPYAIPANNPIGKGDGRQEIWAMGLRNPWRFSFDRTTGDLYIGDVGQDKYEEINFQKAGSLGGQNYGWRCYEASHAYNTADCKDASNYTAPVLEYDHTDKRCSVTGGYVYRGTKYPAMAGDYFFADYCSGQIFYTKNEGTTWKRTLAASTSASISTFGQDNAGELYLADHNNGTIYHLEDHAN